MAQLKQLKNRLKIALKTGNSQEIENLYKEVDDEYFRLRERWDAGFDTDYKEYNWEDFHCTVCTAVGCVRDGFNEASIDILQEEGYKKIHSTFLNSLEN